MSRPDLDNVTGWGSSKDKELVLPAATATTAGAEQPNQQVSQTSRENGSHPRSSLLKLQVKAVTANPAASTQHEQHEQQQQQLSPGRSAGRVAAGRSPRSPRGEQVRLVLLVLTT